MALIICSLGNAAEQSAVVVNGEEIPARLVEAFLQNDREAFELDPATDEGKAKLAQVRADILSEQIDRALIAQEAERRKIAPDAQALEKAEHNEILGMNTEEAYAEFLRKNHFSREDYRRYVLRSALCGKAMSAAFAKEVSVTEAEVREYFDAHHSDPGFQWPERVTGAHILIRASPELLREDYRLRLKLTDGAELEKKVADEIARREKLAETVRAEAAKPGADFGALAKKYSDDIGTRDAGGSLGTFAKGTHVLVLDEAFFARKPGEIAPVVKTEYGFHVIKVLEHKAAGERTPAEMTPAIRAELTRKGQVKKLDEWLTAARKTAKIEQPPNEAVKK